MKAKNLTVAVLLMGFINIAHAQISVDTLQSRKSIWDRKMLWGITFNNSWATIKGSTLPNTYFWKPSVGASVKMEYFFNKNFGVTVGAQYQQKGSGIITPDHDHSLGNPDSTYRARIKLHAFEVPIALVIRSGEVIRNTRFQASVGVSPTRNFKSTYVFYSIEDGYHFIQKQNDQYYKGDLSLTASAGININAGNACIFQIHFYGIWGTKNVYNTDYYPSAQGKTKVIGLKLGWMF